MSNNRLFRKLTAIIRMFFYRLVRGNVRLSRLTYLGKRVVCTTLKSSGKITFSGYVSINDNTYIEANNGHVIFKGNNYVNRNCVIVSKESIIVGEGTTIGPNVIIYDHDHDVINGGFVTKSIEIGKNVWIGAGVIILKGVTVGDGSIIGAGTIITKNIEEYCKVYSENKQVVVHIEGDHKNG